MEDSEKCDQNKAECVKFLPKRRTQIASAAIATLGSFGLGTVFGWSSPALPLLTVTGDLGQLTVDQKSYIVTFALFGALFSAPAAATLMNRIGRKLSMLVFVIPFILGWCIIGFSSSIEMLYVGRFITGLCGAAFMTIVPVYVGEIVDKKIRGALSTMMILMLVTGVLFSFTLGTFTSWQSLSLILVSIPSCLLLLLPFLPETPRYYISKSWRDAAQKSLMYLRGAVRPEQVGPELDRIASNYQQDAEDSSSWKDLFAASSLKPLLISLALIFFQQLCGANAVSFRQVEVIESAGTGLDPSLASIIIAGIQVVLVLVSTFTVDHVGRKLLMLGSEFIMVVGLVGLAVFFHLKEAGGTGTTPEGLGWLPLTSLIVFTVGYNLGMGSIPFVVSAELLPSQTRGLSTAVVIEFYFILSTVTTLYFGPVTEALGWTVLYELFAGICVIGSVFIVTVIPETKGRSAEQIELLFKRKSTVRRVRVRSMRSGSGDGDDDNTRSDKSLSLGLSTSRVDNPTFEV